MPQRLTSANSVKLDLVGAVRRAYLRHGLFIPPISSDEADSDEKKANRQQSGSSKSSQPGPKRRYSDDSDFGGQTPAELTGSEEPQEAHEKLIDVTEKAQDVLFEAETIFP